MLNIFGVGIGIAGVSGAFPYQVIKEAVCSRIDSSPWNSTEASLGYCVEGKCFKYDAARIVFCMIWSLGIWDHAFLCSFLIVDSFFLIYIFIDFQFGASMNNVSRYIFMSVYF